MKQQRRAKIEEKLMNDTSVMELQKTLEQAKVKLIEQQEVLQQLTAEPMEFATVIETGTKQTIIGTPKGVLLVVTPKFSIASGDTVTLAPTGQILQKHAYQHAGELSVVIRILEKGLVEVGEGDKGILAYSGSFLGKLEVGDRIQLDNSKSVIVRSLGQKNEDFNIVETGNVTWDDIGGLVDAKQQMQEAIELPITHADLYRSYKKKPLKGLLLWGPPGCGKSMLAKAAASSIANLHGKLAINSGFIYVKGPEILRKYVGESEGLIRGLFDRARKHKAKHGYPAFLFIDEADAILRKRGTGISSDMESTIVPAFLAEMDGLEDSGCIVGLATNRPDTLDNAITRDGRIDRKIMVPRPDNIAAKDIFRLHLRGVPLVNMSQSDAAKLAVNELFSESRKLYTCKMKSGKEQFFTLSHLVNGALIAGIVDQASSIAMHRNIKGSRQKGVTGEDLSDAVGKVYLENMNLDHQDELAYYIDPIKSEINNITKFSPV
jgi:proteasome-associated ATPase